MMRALIILAACLMLGCATAKPKCEPALSKACDPTQLEHWEEVMFAEID